MSRYAVRLRYMKIILDVASDERATLTTFSQSAAVTDGRAASVMLEVSRLLNGFLSSYRRVNLLDCGGNADAGPGPPKIRWTARPPRRGAISPAAPGEPGSPLSSITGGLFRKLKPRRRGRCSA